MKKYRVILIVLLAAVLSMMSVSAQVVEVDIEANRALEMLNIESFNNADWDLMRSVITDDFVLYQPLSPEPIAGKESVIRFYQSFQAAMPDIGHPNVNVLLADGEWVAVLMPTVGTFENELMGVPPTNEPVISYMLNFFNVQDGLMTEAHFHFDTVDMLQQMRAVPLNPAMPAIERSADELIISFEIDENDLEANKQVVMGFFEDIVNKQDLEPVPEYFTEDWVFHNRVDPHEETYTGYDGVNEWGNSIYSMMPDFTLVMDDILMVAEGDLVAVRWSATGMHTGDVPGIPASGNEIFIQGAAIHRVRDGKISETWFVIDTLGMMAQMSLTEDTASASESIELPAAIEAFNQALYGDATGYEELIHPEWKWFGNGELQFEGHEGFVNATGFWTAVFPDMEVEVIDAIGEGDRWAISYRFTGTNTVDFEPMGVVATGNSMEMYMNSFFYLEDDMLKDCYNVWDWITWFDALGMPYGSEANEPQD